MIWYGYHDWLLGRYVDWNRDSGIRDDCYATNFSSKIQGDLLFYDQNLPNNGYGPLLLFSFVISQQLNGVKNKVESLSITDANEARQALSKLQR